MIPASLKRLYRQHGIEEGGDASVPLPYIGIRVRTGEVHIVGGTGARAKSEIQGERALEQPAIRRDELQTREEPLEQNGLAYPLDRNAGIAHAEQGGHQAPF